MWIYCSPDQTRPDQPTIKNLNRGIGGGGVFYLNEKKNSFSNLDSGAVLNSRNYTYLPTWILLHFPESVWVCTASVAILQCKNYSKCREKVIESTEVSWPTEATLIDIKWIYVEPFRREGSRIGRELILLCISKVYKLCWIVLQAKVDSIQWCTLVQLMDWCSKAQ